MNKRLKAGLAASLVAGLVASGAAQAVLIDRGGGLIYDTVAPCGVPILSENFTLGPGHGALGVMDLLRTPTRSTSSTQNPGDYLEDY